VGSIGLNLLHSFLTLMVKYAYTSLPSPPWKAFLKRIPTLE